MELKAKTNYKQTEVGIIPEDWSTLSLGQILKVKHGKDQKSIQTDAGKYPIYGTGGLMGLTNSYLYDKESVLIGRKGTIDKPRYINKPFWTVDTLFYTEISESIYAKFLYYKFLLINWYSYNEASGVPSLNAKTIEKIKISVPPTLEEQTAIANALSDADKLIAALEKLIAKKKLIKQGAMQQLLSPQKGWEVKTLGEVCDILKGELITSETKIHGEIPVIAGGKTPAYFHNKANRKENTITISGSGANAGYVSFHKKPIFASDCSTIEASEKYSIDYVFYFLKSKQDKIYKMQTGGAQPHIHPSDLYPLEMPLPVLSEQTKIATILSDMDAEITALEAKLEKYRKIKQGMMQNLLSGKIRLV